ncbi:MAG: imidazole glycerol phosphate synthase subunit HisH [Thermodesulfobacteriota bacterium]
MTLAIVDYEAGNLTSVARAIRSFGFEAVVTQDPETILRAGRVIFPGVGAAGSAMASLKRLGLDRVLRQVRDAGAPLLGICLGTQIIFDFSEEDGGVECLGLLPGVTRRFPADLRGNGGKLKVPHMGWNQVQKVREHPVLAGIEPDHEFYFVHSYYADPADPDLAAGWTDYGLRIASIVARDNLIATQFHPEKSGRPGLTLLRNFCEWDGSYA